MAGPGIHAHSTRRGLTFVTRRGRISHLATMLQLRFGDMERDIYAFDTAGVDLIVTDYEPVTARIGWLRDIPCIGIGHLYAFAHRGVPVAGLNLFNRMVMKCFAPASIPLGLHWHHFDRPILPPTVSLEELSQRTSDGEHILVYMPFESVAEVVRTLYAVKGHRFRFYCRVDAPREEGNVELRPLNRPAFVTDLIGCRGVIANTGFTFISEALHLGRKILTNRSPSKPNRSPTRWRLDGWGWQRWFGDCLRTPSPDGPNSPIRRRPTTPMCWRPWQTGSTRADGKTWKGCPKSYGPE